MSTPKGAFATVSPKDRVEILGCPIDPLDMAATVEACLEAAGRRGARQVSINAAKVVEVRRNAELRRFIEGCDVVSADGQSVVWASRLLGRPLPERVAGVDLMSELMVAAEARGLSVYLLGATDQVLSKALEVLAERHPRLEVAGVRNGYFSEAEEVEVAAAISAARPDLLFVAMPSPKKELWLDRYCQELGVGFAMGVGGSLDVLTGMVGRAPALWQRLGMEWAYRMLQEPRRMLRRYALGNATFLGILAVAWLKQRLPTARAHRPG